MEYNSSVELTKEQKILIARINALKQAKNAIILCHNYQRPEIYEVADFIGDSLELCRKAQGTSASGSAGNRSIIVFSGVYFMAESAVILNPHTKVVIPARDAGCALSDMITPQALITAKEKYPDAAVVCYVNSTAAVKAESDILCTSANAVNVVRSLRQRRVLFVPDKNLARFVASKVPEKEIIPWEGYCPIHERLSPEYLLKARRLHPEAKIIAHPECTDEVRAIADYVVSTSGMLKVAEEDAATEFICTTECGMIQRMKRELPHKKFFTVCSVCFDMKKNTLEGIEQALVSEQPEVCLPEPIKRKALQAFEAMFAVTDGIYALSSPHLAPSGTSVTR